MGLHLVTRLYWNDKFNDNSLIIALSAPRNNTLFVTAFAAVLALFVTGCFEGAPRRHPLDPQGENFVDAGGVSVQATTFYAPKSGLADVTITITPGSFIGQTGNDGRVFIPDLATGQYEITGTKQGFASQSSTIDVVNGETIETSIALPGLPAFESIQTTSTHISRWWPPPEEQFQLVITTDITDPDGLADIETVTLEIPALDAEYPLALQNEPGRYAVTLQENQLSLSLATLVGRELFLRANDRAGVTVVSDPLNLVRVIEGTPLAIDPQGLALLASNTPRLRWESLPLNFPFSHSVEIVRVDNNVQNIIWTAQNISADSLAVNTATLPTGQYFWTVSVVDEFGNRSRSREAGFRIP